MNTATDWWTPTMSVAVVAGMTFIIVAMTLFTIYSYIRTSPKD